MDPSDIRAVGTRIPGMAASSTWADNVPSGAASIALASAYWDATAFERAQELAAHVGAARTRMLLWTAGSTKAGWRAARVAAVEDPALELRFVDSPTDAGIFHVKLAGIADATGAWLTGYVGSANWTKAAQSTNLELGVALRGTELAALADLRAWFDAEFAHATPATGIAWDRAIDIAADKSEAAERKQVFAAAALAVPARAAAR